MKTWPCMHVCSPQCLSLPQLQTDQKLSACRASAALTLLEHSDRLKSKTIGVWNAY